MIKLTQEAQKELDAYFDGKDKATIRIYLAPGGCSGPRLALAIDDSGDDDVSKEAGGYNFCVNKELLEQIKGVTIDLNQMGFVLTPENPLPESSGKSACGGCCGGCGG